MEREGLDSGFCAKRINRNIMECKLVQLVFWNLFSAAVLIETLWNVNKCAFAIVNGESSINRNIMECKYEFLIFFLGQFPVLIETLWNVNLITFIPQSSSMSINRNIMECKY